MRKTGMRFTWETTKNGDAINELKKNGIAFEYNHFGELTADFSGVRVPGLPLLKNEQIKGKRYKKWKKDIFCTREKVCRS